MTTSAQTWLNLCRITIFGMNIVDFEHIFLMIVVQT